MNTLSAILWNPDIEIFSIFGISKVAAFSKYRLSMLITAPMVVPRITQKAANQIKKMDAALKEGKR